MFCRLCVFLVACVVFSKSQDKDIGDSCRNGGICKRIGDCPTAEALFYDDPDAVEICTFESDNTAVLCCEANKPPKKPPTGQPIDNDLSISEKKCIEYAKFVYTEEPSITNPHDIQVKDHCARTSAGLVAGGKPALPREFPHMVEIGYGRGKMLTFQCGGSLISERWVLSAAHCSDLEKLGRPRLARIGDLDNQSDDDGARPVTVNINKIENHPNYRQGEVYNDIALYRLERDVRFSPYIRPTCLQVNHRIEQIAAEAIGFGHIKLGGEYNNKLQKVTLNIVDYGDCNRTYRGAEKTDLPRGIVETQMLCAGDEEGKDTCKGDSGSSLLLRSRDPYCTFSQVGITSFGRFCGFGYPGVYTRVSFYVPWIEQIVWPEESKQFQKDKTT